MRKFTATCYDIAGQYAFSINNKLYASLNNKIQIDHNKA